MDDIIKLSIIQDQLRQVIGLYEAEKAKRLKLVRSMAIINSWTTSALEHEHPFGNNYRFALLTIQRETAIAKEVK